ncbi:choice-of-anchor J domain-containing protein [Prevotella sp.]|uniref:choice-of-anchor J domain-containing protein n=1 Tax=Prevotella sp. TaxID=59823 RepID=UPI0030803C9E
MKKLFLLSLSIAATCVASAQTVLESETLPAGHESQVVQDEAGRIYRRLVKPYAGSNETVSPLAKAAKAGDAKFEQTFYEGFEGWKESLGYDWIPEGWTEINTPENTPTEEMLLHNINNSWYVYASSDFFQEMTTDGVNEAFIHYAYDNEKYGITAAAQDEWLVTPTIALKENETLHFMLQADFFNIYNCKDFDYRNIKYAEPRETVCTMSVMITTDDAQNWSRIWDLEADVASKMTDKECYANSDLKIKHFDVDLSAYANKNVKIAFRYIRSEGMFRGNSMILDGVTVDHPSAAGINTVSASAKYEYYDVNGTKLPGKPSKKGLYIRKGENKTEKMML